MLSPEQIAHFHTFGFLLLPKHLSSEEIYLMKAEAGDIFDEERGRTPFTGEKWEAVQPFFERRPFLVGLPADDRIYGIGLDLCGPGFTLSVTEGNLQKGDTPWHGPIPMEDYPLNIKIAIYPDPLTRDTGCLRVIPGSHVAGNPDLLAPLRNRVDYPDFMPFGIRPKDIPNYAIESQPGDVIVFTEYMLHASFGGGAGRHQHAVNFMSLPNNDEQLDLVRKQYEGRRFSLHPSESYINSENPRLRDMVSKLVEWGFSTSSA